MITNKRFRRLTGILAAGLIALAAAFAMAAPAQATVELSTHMPIWDPPGLPEIEVHGSEVPTAATGATHVAIALCDIDGATTPEELGRKCDAVNAIAPQDAPIGEYVENGLGDELVLAVQPMFLNWDFTINRQAEGETECAGVDEGDEDCAVVVSFYSWSTAPVGRPTFLHAEAEEITFETP